MTSERLIELMDEDFGLGSTPVEARPTGRVLLLSKNPQGARQRLAIELDCPSNNAERLAVERIIQLAGLGNKLKTFGLRHDDNVSIKEHMSIGHVNINQISDAEAAEPALLLNPASMREVEDFVPYEIPDKMIFDRLRVPLSS